MHIQHRRGKIVKRTFILVAFYSSIQCVLSGKCHTQGLNPEHTGDKQSSLLATEQAHGLFQDLGSAGSGPCNRTEYALVPVITHCQWNTYVQVCSGLFLTSILRGTNSLLGRNYEVYCSHSDSGARSNECSPLPQRIENQV